MSSQSTTVSTTASVDSNQNRGQNALQRRALQLKRWYELMESESRDTNDAKPTKRASVASRVQFSSATLFLSAVAQNDIEECERLLLSSNDLDVNVTTGDGLTALHQMAIDDNQEMVVWLLDNNADVNCRDNEGWTALHASASCGHLEIVRILLSREETDVFAINCDGELARDVSDGNECIDLIEERMKKDLELTINIDDFCDDTQDDDKRQTIPEMLLKEMRKKELNSIENDFKEFLRRNSENKLNKQLITDWIERTRDPTSRATLLHVCAAKGYNNVLTRVLEIICPHVSIDEFVDCDGFTAAHASAFWQQMTSFEILLKFGANFELETRDARLVSDLCHENPKIMELISETKKSRELQNQSKQQLESNSKLSGNASETQRKLNAKRQRESRRPTQGVSFEDIEMALKTTQNALNVTDDSLSTSPPPMPSSPPPTTLTTTTTTNTTTAQPLVEQNGTSVPIHPQRRRPKRRSTGIEDNLNLNDMTDTTTTSVATSGVVTTVGNDCVDSHKTILSRDDALNAETTTKTTTMSSFGSWRTTSSLNPRSVPKTTTTNTSRHPSTSTSSLSRSLSQLPFGSSSVSQMPFITTAPSYQTTSTTHRRQPHMNRRNPSAAAAQTPSSGVVGRLRSSSSQSNLSYLSNPNNSCLNERSIFTTTNPVSSGVTSLGELESLRSRSTSRASSIGSQVTTDESENEKTSEVTSDMTSSDRERARAERERERERDLDYKKLYKELLKENEFLIKKIKEIDLNRKFEKEFQEFQREKRQYVRRISELEEELKQKEDLIKENLRLKDENSALIRVISKLSK